MAIAKQEFSAFIKQFQFRELFNVLGWNNIRIRLPITFEERTFLLQAVAEKSGFMILICPPDADGLIPEYSKRRKLETQVTKLIQEHLIIYLDENHQEQIWQLAVRQAGKPLKVTETRYNIAQDPELLYQRASGLFFELDEDDRITIVDVKQRVTANFHQNAEKVTKLFYDKFKKEHTSFISFIKGIEGKVDREWYASLMLNRLMFCYFIQKKGFLDSNKNYLRDKLRYCQERRGDNNFYSFYRNFLLVLFHNGLNELNQTDEVKDEIGHIPYLNGGLFDEHELEKLYQDIDIEDDAFERVFDFFDQYEWHLDTRANSTGREINPDVIGYIFEKYINDRAEMGAYYTKEDITEYISKNTILPWVFDETQRNYAKAFEPEGEIWQRVRNSADDYIYDAVKYGVPGNALLFEDLPDEIKAGFRPDMEQRVVTANQTPHLWEIRKPWNQKAPSEIALPTETYRELIERRQRCDSLKVRIMNGEINQISDFITYNLNIRQFAQDVIENTQDPDFLRHFYKAINKVTILDPTCGSGAFLFAAMNILEPLYEASLLRMRAFVAEEDRLNEEAKRTFKNQYKYFRQVLSETQNEHHPNLQYFVYKNIILHNLYGVDIMKEAVEIAKLRLFLKLVATVDADFRKPNMGLEPLPDIDFNIRAGNTLVGFATEEELNNAFYGNLDFGNTSDKIKEKCDIVARTFTRYKEIQLSTGDDYQDFKAAKEELNSRLKELNRELNQLLHKQASGLEFESWLSSHQPFHWFAEFYEIIHDHGGFDVVIGNPPYVQITDISYSIKFEEAAHSNLFAYVQARSFLISNLYSFCGLIVPMSLTSIRDYNSLRSKLLGLYGLIYITNHSIRPRPLFEGVSQRVSIAITAKKDRHSDVLYSTKYMRTNDPSILFHNFSYTETTQDSKRDKLIPKLSLPIESEIWKKINASKSDYKHVFSKKEKSIYIKDYGETYWVFPFTFSPYLTPIKSFKEIKISVTGVHSLFCFFNSTTHYFFYITISDCWHFGGWHLREFPINIDYENRLTSLSLELESSFKSNRITRYDKRTSGKIYEYQVYKSKSIIDKIDAILAQHYGFTEEELDFIINYDIKYRMGKELGNGDEEELI